MFGIDNDIFRATFGFCIGVALFRINDGPTNL